MWSFPVRAFPEYPLQPWTLTDEALVELERLQRRVHDSGAGFNGAEVVHRSDFAAENSTREEGCPITFIDWLFEHTAELAP
jgi:hypothetical protein